MKLTRKEFDRIKDIKTLDIQLCTFCQRLNILNLGWKPFGKFYCRLHETEYLVCWELCYKVCLNIWGCELYREVPRPNFEPPKPNKSYDKCDCYLCGKELKGASKKGVVKNRNNPGFWGIESEWKILCLGCIGREFYRRMVDWQRKKWREYIRRGYE